jgi:hypothetical protein
VHSFPIFLDHLALSGLSRPGDGALDRYQTAAFACGCRGSARLSPQERPSEKRLNLAVSAPTSIFLLDDPFKVFVPSPASLQVA